MADPREKPIPFEDNHRAQRVLRRLQKGPATTLELQRDLPMIHVARQIWELRHWYGWKIVTGRRPTESTWIAEYRVLGQRALLPLERVGGKVPAPVGPAVPRCPTCHVECDLTRSTATLSIVNGHCVNHGWAMVRV